MKALWNKIKKEWKHCKGSARRAAAYFRYRETYPVQEGLVLVLDGERSGVGAVGAPAQKIKIRTTKFYRALASAQYIYAKEPLPEGFAKREGQVCLLVAQKPEMAWNSYFQADYVLCETKEEADRLAKNGLLSNFCMAKLLVVKKQEVLWEYLKEKKKSSLGAACTTNNYKEQNFENRALVQKSGEIQELEFAYNGRKNVILYVGNLEKNGLTMSCVNLLHTVDRTKYNYAVLYCLDDAEHPEENKQAFPVDVPLLGFYRNRCLSVREQLPFVLWKFFKKLPYSFVEGTMEKLAKRNVVRIFGSSRLHTAVQFSGYHEDMIETMACLSCNRIIYVHSDMEREMALKGNTDSGMLAKAYHQYDSVAVVTEGMLPGVERIANRYPGEQRAHIVLSKNVIAKERIEQLAEEPLRFDDATRMNVSQEKLIKALDSEQKKFISIGRFSAEKAHDRMIRAFEQLHKEQPDTCLFIVGGYGDLWEKTVQQVKESSCPEAVYLIRYMTNPYPLLKQCDYFVLASLYEGFGLVLAEADILGIPCFSTDIPGPRAFMQQSGGLLVENSEEGILSGFRACLTGAVANHLQVDYEAYNKEAAGQFCGAVSNKCTNRNRK